MKIQDILSTDFTPLRESLEKPNHIMQWETEPNSYTGKFTLDGYTIGITISYINLSSDFPNQSLSFVDVSFYDAEKPIETQSQLSNRNKGTLSILSTIAHNVNIKIKEINPTGIFFSALYMNDEQDGRDVERARKLTNKRIRNYNNILNKFIAEHNNLYNVTYRFDHINGITVLAVKEPLSTEVQHYMKQYADNLYLKYR